MGRSPPCPICDPLQAGRGEEGVARPRSKADHMARSPKRPDMPRRSAPSIHPQAEAQGKDVAYGDVIQLEHVATGKFLVVKKLLAHTERSYYCILLEDGGEGAWWEVSPGYKFRRTGDPVYYHDALHLASFSTKKGFLHISEVPVQGLKAHSPYVKDVYEINCAPTRCAPPCV